MTYPKQNLQTVLFAKQLSVWMALRLAENSIRSVCKNLELVFWQKNSSQTTVDKAEMLQRRHRDTAMS